MAAIENPDRLVPELEAKVASKGASLAKLQGEIDELYGATFGKTEEEWADLGRRDPDAMKSLIANAEKLTWQHFQHKVHTLALMRNRQRAELKQLEDQLGEAILMSAAPAAASSGPEGEHEEEEEGGADTAAGGYVAGREARIVLISGFESFNVALYRQAAAAIRERCPGVRLTVFSDRDIMSKRKEVEEALAEADAFFGSLIFDYDQCEWLKERVQSIPVRLVFESSLELMATTSLGSFVMSGGKSKGMPPAVKAVLSKFGGGREEDRMVGYLSFLKIGPKLLRFVPGKKVRDLRNWLTVYGYWNQGGLENVTNLFIYLADEYLVKLGAPKGRLIETPPLGLYHPDHDGYFTSPAEYVRWFRSAKAGMPRDAPVVATLLYRKHVITQQPYIPRLLRMMEKDGLIPVPIFINGVEAHTVVRDMLTSAFEQEQRKRGVKAISSLKGDALAVDAVVSTIGFPLVGGPAGTMEGGRQAEVAKSILSAKNVPYFVAGPLLIQDIPSWQKSGVQGLQSVVLYSLPELDGAIDAVPLGGLVGDGIHLVPERVRRLTARVRSWVELKRTPPAERQVAIVLYGFPPGVGATGTAALLNVPKSLENLLLRLKQEGYDLGEMGSSINGEDLVTMLSALDQDSVVNVGRQGAERAALIAGEKVRAEGRELPPAAATAEPIEPKQLRSWLGDNMTGRMEKMWGELRTYRGLRCDAEGRPVVSGLRLGNVWIGVQPILGVEGDPMRLLFERDLTPHPQYAAFYKWLQNGFRADAVIHFGMHGTVEWLPGSPLGNTGLSWPDVLLGNMPNLYVYAANNPSESIVAKRRGYGTIVSYNVPPYGRAGLYKELASLRELISEYREDPAKNRSLRPAIVGALASGGIQADCPFREGDPPEFLSEDTVMDVPEEEFDAYMTRLYQYLAVVENRLFSEGLHTLGEPPSPDQTAQYLSAYFGEDLSPAAVETIAGSSSQLAEVRRKLEELYLREGGSPRAAGGEELGSRVEEALAIRDLLHRSTEELDSLVKGLNGDYILPAVGGDLLRDGSGVLPTGRNIHALDPYRMPSAAAWERGSAIAENVIRQHREQNEGAYPETVAVMLWGLDAIKTRGESVAIALALVGARPLKEGTGRVVRFELRPLEELGRPRIDILANMSGIFRDSFANVVELLDDLFKRAAALDEPAEMNFVRKHTLALRDEGMDVPASRIFSNPAGDYGSMVNERIGAADWESGAELGDTWQSRNSFSYGRGEQGVARPEVLAKLLSTTQRIVQEIDSVEYGLTDIQEYYANTGAMKNAAQSAQGGKKVGCSIVETYGKDLNPRELESTLRLEYRSKLLNPKWAQKMAAQGSGGAFEISQRMTALVGWGGTAGFSEDWVYDQAAETYAMDADMAALLRKNNPQAFQNVLKRMLEAAGRGLWNADNATLERLRELFAEVDDELEGVASRA